MPYSTLATKCFVFSCLFHLLLALMTLHSLQVLVSALPITSKPIEGRAEEIAWQEWQREQPEQHTQQKPKKVTAKSIFTLPLRQCPPNHELYKERCIPIVNINPSELLNQEILALIGDDGRPSGSDSLGPYDYDDAGYVDDLIAYEPPLPVPQDQKESQVPLLPHLPSMPSLSDAQVNSGPYEAVQKPPNDDAPMRFNIFQNKFPTANAEIIETDVRGGAEHNEDATEVIAAESAWNVKNNSSKNSTYSSTMLATTSTQRPTLLAQPPNAITSGSSKKTSSNVTTITGEDTSPVFDTHLGNTHNNSTLNPQLMLSDAAAFVLSTPSSIEITPLGKDNLADASSVQFVSSSLEEPPASDVPTDIDQLLKTDSFFPDITSAPSSATSNNHHIPTFLSYDESADDATDVAPITDLKKCCEIVTSTKTFKDADSSASTLTMTSERGTTITTADVSKLDAKQVISSKAANISKNTFVENATVTNYIMPSNKVHNYQQEYPQLMKLTQQQIQKQSQLSQLPQHNKNYNILKTSELKPALIRSTITTIPFDATTITKSITTATMPPSNSKDVSTTATINNQRNDSTDNNGGKGVYAHNDHDDDSLQMNNDRFYYQHLNVLVSEDSFQAQVFNSTTSAKTTTTPTSDNIMMNTISNSEDRANVNNDAATSTAADTITSKQNFEQELRIINDLVKVKPKQQSQPQPQPAYDVSTITPPSTPSPASPPTQSLYVDATAIEPFKLTSTTTATMASDATSTTTSKPTTPNASLLATSDVMPNEDFITVSLSSDRTIPNVSMAYGSTQVPTTISNLSINTNRSNRNSKIIRINKYNSTTTSTSTESTATTASSNSNKDDDKIAVATSSSVNSSGYGPFWWLPIGWRLDRQADKNGDDQSLLLRFFTSFYTPAIRTTSMPSTTFAETARAL